ncbi:MAG: HDOD domain-containing protein, partial [Planctomycetota bacterium]
MFDKDFEELKLTGNLPSPSGVGLAVLRITQSESPSLAELVQVIRADPALSGRLIKQANTMIPRKPTAPEESYRSPVSTVEAAARRLGATTVRSMALGFSLVSSTRSGVCEEFDYDRFWSLSICSAVAAEELARRFGTIDPDEAFTCALQSRVGMLALATVHPTQYSRILRETRGQRLASIFEAEAGAFEITHPEVTAAMLIDWDLPEFFAEVVVRLGTKVRATQEEGDEGGELLRILNAAWRMAPINM